MVLRILKGFRWFGFFFEFLVEFAVTWEQLQYTLSYSIRRPFGTRGTCINHTKSHDEHHATKRVKRIYDDFLNACGDGNFSKVVELLESVKVASRRCVRIFTIRLTSLQYNRHKYRIPLYLVFLSLSLSLFITKRFIDGASGVIRRFLKNDIMNQDRNFTISQKTTKLLCQNFIKIAPLERCFSAKTTYVPELGS